MDKPEARTRALEMALIHAQLLRVSDERDSRSGKERLKLIKEIAEEFYTFIVSPSKDS